MSWSWKATGGLAVLFCMCSIACIASGAIIKRGLGLEWGGTMMAVAGIVLVWAVVVGAVAAAQVYPEAFARHAIKLATHKVAFLCRIQFLEGLTRKELFSISPLARVWVFSWRLPISRGEVKPEAERQGSMATYAWFVWEHGYTGKPTLGWI